VSLYYPLSPVQMLCPDCRGFGHAPDGAVCRSCGGIGRTWVEGGPSFGCRMKLADRKVGEVVTLGNGDRGRVVRHNKRGTPTTELALIEEFFETEAAEPTSYPSATGVASSLPANAKSENTTGQTRSRHDQVDPLQRETRPM